MLNFSKKSVSMISSCFKKTVLLFSLSASFLSAVPAQATIVQFQTVMGDFQVNLYDKTTPKTVENFLAYVTSDAYKNSVIHRLVPGFILQGGGFQYPNKSPLVAIVQAASVINEPVYANKRGTIAMAKLGNDANSATNQWFFNLADNRANLDNQNGGFTVFGEVMGNGMAIVDAMAGLNIFDMGDVFSSFPLRNYTETDAIKNTPITDHNLVLILNVVVLNANIDTAQDLMPEKTTNPTLSSSVSSSLLSSVSTSSALSSILSSSSSVSISSSSNQVASPSSSGGGSFSLLELLFLFSISVVSARKFSYVKL